MGRASCGAPSRGRGLPGCKWIAPAQRHPQPSATGGQGAARRETPAARASHRALGPAGDGRQRWPAPPGRRPPLGLRGRKARARATGHRPGSSRPWAQPRDADVRVHCPIPPRHRPGPRRIAIAAGCCRLSDPVAISGQAVGRGAQKPLQPSPRNRGGHTAPASSPRRDGGRGERTRRDTRHGRTRRGHSLLVRTGRGPRLRRCEGSPGRAHASSCRAGSAASPADRPGPVACHPGQPAVAGAGPERGAPTGRARRRPPRRPARRPSATRAPAAAGP